MRRLHSAILGLCALIESFPYSVEPWMPPLTEGWNSFRPHRHAICSDVYLQYFPNMQPIPLRFQRRYVTVRLNSRRYERFCCASDI